MINNSTNINKTNNHLSSQQTNTSHLRLQNIKKTITCVVENPGPGLGKAQSGKGGLNQLSPMTIQILTNNEKQHRLASTIEDHTLSQNKMNYELMLTYDTPTLRQTGSRNLMGPKTLPTIWGTYMKLVTKYQISAINSC